MNYRERIALGQCVSPMTTERCPVCVDVCEAHHNKHHLGDNLKGESPKHEKVLIPKGRLMVIKKVITSMKKEDKQFCSSMEGLPPIQELRTHYYLFVPFEYARLIVEKYKELHYEMYGYAD